MEKTTDNQRLKKITWGEALSQFLLLKRAQGCSETTLKDYQQHVEMFFNRFPNNSDYLSLRKSIYIYMADKIKPATYNLRFVYLRAFFNWCVTEGYLTDNPLKDFKRKKATERIVDISDETLKLLLETPDKSCFAGLRDYALILLTLDTGIRPGEAFQLKESDIDLKQLSVRVRAEVSKTRSERILPILPVTSATIQKLIKNRCTGWGKDIPLFCTFDGRQMNRRTWAERVNIYSEIIGEKIRPYDLRHAFALMYLRNGGNAFGLQRVLGHSDIQMTKRYVNLTAQDLRESHIKASPLNSIIALKGQRVRKNII